MQYEMMVLLYFVGTLVAACVIGVLSSLFVGWLKYKGKVSDGKSFVFVVLCNAVGIGTLMLLRILTPGYIWYYSGDINLDNFVNGAAYFLLAMVLSAAMAVQTYKVTKDRLPVVGYSITTTLKIVRSLYGSHFGDETSTGDDWKEQESKRVDFNRKS